MFWTFKFRRRADRRRIVRDLLTRDDRLLDDMGLTRAELETAESSRDVETFAALRERSRPSLAHPLRRRRA